jgi:putative ABC transport system permease protein
MNTLLQDIHYALRQLRRAPGFAFTVVLTLALSVGVATAVFCVFDTVMLRPLPYDHPERIVTISSNSRSGYGQPPSWPSYLAMRAQAHSFVALAAYAFDKKATLESPSSGPVSLDCVISSGNFFQVFGVKPILGRTYIAAEEQDGTNDVVVLSYEAWQRFFNGDRGVLNQTVKLNGRATTVLGVMPAGFRYPLEKRNSVYTPRLVDENGASSRGNHWLGTVALLKDGVSIQQAQADLTQVFQNLGRAYPSDEGRTVHLDSLALSATWGGKGPLWILLGAVLAVMAIGCVNVAGLLLARGVKREREMAMRSALGAVRARIIRQVLTEGLLLALLGAAGGVLLASILLDLMRDFLIHALWRGPDIHINPTVLAAAIAAAVAASLAASLYPALRLSGIDPNRALKAGGSAGTQRGQHRLRSGFLITQVALTLVLLAVSGLLIRMVSRYRNADLGFDPAHLLTVNIALSPAKYQGHDPIGDFYRPLEERVSHLPGVQAAGLIDMLPIARCWRNQEVQVAGQPPNPPNQVMLAEVRLVSPGYFDAMGIPLHRGRRLSPSLDRVENISGAGRFLVNEAFVRKFIPVSLDPTAQRIEDDAKQDNWSHLVGVTGNVRQNIYDPPLPEFDFLMDELDLKDRATALANMTLVVRTSGDPRQVISAVRAIVHELDPTVPFEEPRTMTEVVSEVLVFERMESWLFGIFASLALVLALVGLYGLISHEVEQSSRDIGVRMALGATRPSILTMVLKRVAWMLSAGTIAGLALTLVARKLIGMVIYFDAGQEAGGFLLVALLLMVAGLVAALIPARRAASIEPMQALRTE